jgi:fucose 4-O-acetylase-like acetyltransferase
MAKAASERSLAVDVARGLAIVGVVFNHSVDGLIGAGTLSSSSAIAAVNDALYIFRMPALIVLVGLFIPRGVAKAGWRSYVARRATLLLYLYLVWQLVQGLAELLTEGVRNGDTSVWDIVTFWFPLAHLWFLPFLAVATAVVVALRPWCPGRGRPFSIALLVVVTVSAWGWDLDVAGLRGIALVGFLALGALVGLERARRWLSASPWLHVATLTAATLAFLAALLAGPEPATVAGGGDFLVRLASVAGALSGVVALMSASALLARVPLIGRGLAAIGRVTLPIYLAHVIAVAGMRVVLMALGMDGATMLFVLVPLGVLLPWLLSIVAQRTPLRWLFEYPRAFNRWIPAADGRVGRVRQGERSNGADTVKVQEQSGDPR